MRPQEFWNSSQLRAARALRDWAQRDLARAAGIPVRGVSWAENGDIRAERYFPSIVDALERHGVVFIGQNDPNLGAMTAVALFDKPPQTRPRLALVVDNT